MKFLIIAIASFAVIMVIYEVLVRRVNILRVLFGMKIKNVSKRVETSLCVVGGLICVLVVTLMVTSSTVKKISPPPTKTGLYLNKEFGIQMRLPAAMNKPGRLNAYDMVFHIRHPNKTLYLKIRKKVTPVNQPLDPQAGEIWIKRIMESFGMMDPKILSTEFFISPGGTKALYARIKFKTRTSSMVGTYAYFDKNGKRLFIAGYNEGGFGPLEKIMNGLTVQ